MAKVKKNPSGIRSLDSDIEQFVEDVAKDMAITAKRIVPVDTGKLQQSITVVKEDDLTHLIGTNVDYALFVEDGTQNQKAQPYLKPAAGRLKELIFKNRKRT